MYILELKNDAFYVGLCTEKSQKHAKSYPFQNMLQHYTLDLCIIPFLSVNISITLRKFFYTMCIFRPKI